MNYVTIGNDCQMQNCIILSRAQISNNVKISNQKIAFGQIVDDKTFSAGQDNE